MTKPLGIDRQRMGREHELFLAKLFGGRMSRGSGNQWREPADGRHDHHDGYAFAWDGKSAQGASITVTRAMIDKIIEQAGGERPMIGIRFYDNYALDVAYDWVAVPAVDLSEMREEVLRLRDSGAEYLQTIARLSGQLSNLRKDLAEEQGSYRETEQALNECRAECMGLQAEVDPILGEI